MALPFRKSFEIAPGVRINRKRSLKSLSWLGRAST